MLHQRTPASANRIAAIPALKELHAAHGERLAIIGLCYDEQREHPMRHVRAQQVPWRQCTTAGDGGNLHTLFASGLPTFVLIDPRGRIVVRGHDLEPVRAALADAAPED